MAAKKKIKTQAVESKPELKEYLKKLAPDFSVLDMVEQYCEQGYPLQKNNLLGDSSYIFNDLFVYFNGEKNHNNFDSHGMLRGIFKYETVDGLPLQSKEEDYCITQVYDNNIVIVVSKSGGIIISGVKYLCGVFF